MIRRPPRSTLFPYRRSSDLTSTSLPAVMVSIVTARLGAAEVSDRSLRVRRSEEHTSELQSRLHLVCRLLLEKKKSAFHSLASLRFHISKTGAAYPVAPACTS